MEKKIIIRKKNKEGIRKEERIRRRELKKYIYIFIVKLGGGEQRRTKRSTLSRWFYPRVRSKRADAADIIYGQHDSIKHPYKIIGY